MIPGHSCSDNKQLDLLILSKMLNLDENAPFCFLTPERTADTVELESS